MHTTARLMTGAALAAASLGLAAASTTSAVAGDFGVLEISPKTAAPGDKITVSTSACGTDSSATGDASSIGAASFPLTSQTQGAAVTGQFKAPWDARAGTYAISVTCKNGKKAKGDVKIGGVQPAVPVPATPEKPLAPEPPAPLMPEGHVETGVGGSVHVDTPLIAAGSAVLATTAAGGIWLLRRRASGTRTS